MNEGMTCTSINQSINQQTIEDPFGSSPLRTFFDVPCSLGGRTDEMVQFLRKDTFFPIALVPVLEEDFQLTSANYLFWRT